VTSPASNAATPVTLSVGGVDYSSFESMQISVGIEQLAGEFDLRCADRWAIQGQRLPVLPGQTCSINIAGTPVITGFIDDSNPSYDAESHHLQIQGRDATGDLVDCAALIDGQDWTGRSLQEIATALCKPFGIPVSVVDYSATSPALSVRDPFRQAHINPGETVYEVLSRLAQIRGALLISDQLGGLMITRAGSMLAKTGLKRGVNILSGGAQHSHKKRFHTYNVVGQMSGASLGAADQYAAQKILASETDPAIRASRTTVIVISDSADTGMAKRVASWARASATAKGERATLYVDTWLDGAAPWKPNSLINVDDDYLRLSGQWLIAHIDFVLDAHQGEIAALTLAPPDGFIPNPAAAIDPAARR